MNIKVDKIVDAKGIACPIPLVRTQNAINQMESNEVLEVHTTDRASVNDLNAWARTNGHELLSFTEDAGVYRFQIKKH